MADSGSLISSKNSDKSRISNSINRTTSETLRLTESDKIVIQPTTLSASTPRKKTSFQITSVTVGSRTSNDGGDDSADDLDESHTEDISEVIDNSRVTDIENETPSYSEDTFSKDDVFFNASSSLVSAPVIPTSSQYGLAILATPDNSDPNATNQSAASENSSASEARGEVTESVINLGVVNTKHDSEMRDMHPPAPRTERFKVVKIESTEPFKRGRWVCMDYLDHNIAQNLNQNSNVKSEGVDSSISLPASIINTETSTGTVVESGITTNTLHLEDQQIPTLPSDQLMNSGGVINQPPPQQQQQIDPSQAINCQTQTHPQGQQVHPQQTVPTNQTQVPASQPPQQQISQQQLAQPPPQTQQIPQQNSQLTMNTPASVPASYASISPGQSLQSNVQMVPTNVNNQNQQTQVPQQAQSLSQTHIQQLITNTNQHQSLQPQQIQQVLANANIMPLQQLQNQQQQHSNQQQQSIPNQQAPMQNQQQPMSNQPQSMSNQQPIQNQQQPIQNQQQPLQNQSQMQGQQQMQNQQQPLQNQQQQPMAAQQQPMQNQQQTMQNQQQTMSNQQQGMPPQQQPQQQTMQSQQQPMLQQTMQQLPPMQQQAQQYQQQPQQQYQSMPQQPPQQQTMMQQQMPQQNMQPQMQSVPQVHMQSVPSSMQQMPIQPPSSQSQSGMMAPNMQMQQQQGSQMHQVSYSPPMGQPNVTQTSSQPQVQNLIQGMHPQMQGFQQSQLLASLQAANLMGVPSQTLLPQYYTTPGNAAGIMSSQGGGGMMPSMSQGSSMSMQASTSNIPPLQTFPVTSLPQMIQNLPQTTPVPTSVQGYSLSIGQSSHLPTPTAQQLATGNPLPHSIPPSLLQHQAYASLGTAAQTYAHSVVNSVPSLGSSSDQSHSTGEVHHDPLLAPTAALLESLVEVTATSDDLPTGDDAESASGASAVAIDNKIEQAMDLVKSHLMFAVREEVEVLKEKINELMERISQLESENNLLRASASPEIIAQLPPPLPQQTSNPP